MQIFDSTDFGSHGVLARGRTELNYWLRSSSAGPDAPLVMFLHGAALDHRMWAPQMDAFAAAYRVLTLDMRGHGRSRPADDLSFSAFVDDAWALLDALGAGPVVIAGLSMGGNVAQEMVFQRPERVAALICMDCTCNTLVPFADRLAVPLSTALFEPMMAVVSAKALRRQIAEASAADPEARAYVENAAALLTKGQLTHVMKTLLTSLHHEPGYRIAAPLLLMCGAQDKLGNIAKVMPKWARRDAGSTLAIVPDAAHCANIDNPAFVNRTALDWLGRALGT